MFSLFVWLHALPGVFSFPWQQLESSVAAQSWFSWAASIFYFSFGMLFTKLLFEDSPKWPLLMSGLTLICLLHTTPGVYALATANGTITESLSSWGRLINQWLESAEIGLLLKTYLIWSWPFYGIILLGFSVMHIWLRNQTHETAA